MADQHMDPDLEREVREAINAVQEVLAESRARAAERQELARQLFAFAARGRALCLRWEIIQARREGRLYRQAGA